MLTTRMCQIATIQYGIRIIDKRQIRNKRLTILMDPKANSTYGRSDKKILENSTCAGNHERNYHNFLTSPFVNLYIF